MKTLKELEQEMIDAEENIINLLDILNSKLDCALSDNIRSTFAIYQATKSAYLYVLENSDKIK